MRTLPGNLPFRGLDRSKNTRRVARRGNDAASRCWRAPLRVKTRSSVRLAETASQITMVRTRGVMAATVIRFDYSAGVGGAGAGSPRRIGLACAAWRPSTADLVTNIGSGIDFCCTAVLVQPRSAPPNRRAIQPTCRSFRAMSRFPPNLFVEVPDEAILPYHLSFGGDLLDS